MRVLFSGAARTHQHDLTVIKLPSSRVRSGSRTALCTAGLADFAVSSDLNVNVDACREFDAHQSFNEFLRGFADLDESLMCALFELFAAVLVLVDCAQDRDDLFLRGERYRTGNLSTVSLRDVYDLRSCGVDDRVLVASESDLDLFTCCLLELPPSLLFITDGLYTRSGVSDDSSK